MALDILNKEKVKYVNYDLEKEVMGGKI